MFSLFFKRNLIVKLENPTKRLEYLERIWPQRNEQLKTQECMFYVYCFVFIKNMMKIENIMTAQANLFF
jgi:hypothetical protein